MLRGSVSEITVNCALRACLAWGALRCASAAAVEADAGNCQRHDNDNSENDA